uniref:Uncharacterized protein n=1 Tax=Desulfobacca acetoxidans TaxID=60893 RepID=A0A7C5AL74_9BACT
MKLTTVQREILESLFRDWAAPKMEAYQQHPGPLPPGRYYLALMQALHGPYSLPEIVERAQVGVSHGLLKVLRGTPPFREIAREAARDFANFVGWRILEASSIIERLVLSELLVILPGFDLAGNPIMESLKHGLAVCEENPNDNSFKRLHNLLLTFRDIVRLAHDTTPPERWPAKEGKLAGAISPLLDSIDFLTTQSEVEPELKEAIGSLTLSLQFLTSYSKVVF